MFLFLLANSPKHTIFPQECHGFQQSKRSRRRRWRRPNQNAPTLCETRYSLIFPMVAAFRTNMSARTHTHSREKRKNEATMTTPSLAAHSHVRKGISQFQFYCHGYSTARSIARVCAPRVLFSFIYFCMVAITIAWTQYYIFFSVQRPKTATARRTHTNGYWRKNSSVCVSWHLPSSIFVNVFVSFKYLATQKWIKSGGEMNQFKSKQRIWRPRNVKSLQHLNRSRSLYHLFPFSQIRQSTVDGLCACSMYAYVYPMSITTFRVANYV